MSNFIKCLNVMILLCAFSCQNQNVNLNNQIVEASCGQCHFGMKVKSKKGCDLAIRYQNKSYFVVGSDIDDHGDAHAEDGFCQRIRKAKVSGTIKNNEFRATQFELLPL